MVVTDDDNEAKYDFNLHKCARTKRSNHGETIRTFENIQINQIIILFSSSCRCMLLVLWFVYVLFSTK